MEAKDEQTEFTSRNGGRFTPDLTGGNSKESSVISPHLFYT